MRSYELFNVYIGIMKWGLLWEDFQQLGTFYYRHETHSSLAETSFKQFRLRRDSSKCNTEEGMHGVSQLIAFHGSR